MERCVVFFMRVFFAISCLQIFYATIPENMFVSVNDPSCPFRDGVLYIIWNVYNICLFVINGSF